MMPITKMTIPEIEIINFLIFYFNNFFNGYLNALKQVVLILLLNFPISSP